MFGNDFIEMYKEDKKYFETGFRDIDECIWGVTKGSIITVGARPSMGKTSFSISVCNHLLETGKKVLFCELDSTQVMLERQFIYLKTQILPKKYSKDDWAKISEAIDYYNSKPLSVYCKVNMSIDELEEKIKAEKPDVVFIDCIQCLKMPKAPNLTEAINLAIKEVKRIAVENDIIVVLTSQLSRSNEYRFEKVPQISDLRNGSLLEDLSDVVMLIHRPAYYDKDDAELRNRADIITVKNKFGGLSLISLDFLLGIFLNKPLETKWG